MRGTGKTTRQMENLPIGALFVWCNDKLDYPKHLQKKINRPDIKVVGPQYVLDRRWQGQEFSGVDIDHAYGRCNGYVSRSLFYELFATIRIKT